MNCRQFEETLMDVAREIELQEREYRSLQAHLLSCSNCREELEQQRDLGRHLRIAAISGEESKASAHLELFLLAAFRVRAAATPKKWFQRYTFPAIAAALLVLLTAGLWLRTKYYEPAPAAVAETQTNRGTTDEVSTEFIPLMHGDVPTNSLQMFRVKLPRSALTQVGLPMNQERSGELIDAEVIVGDDSLPRAIRFINRETQ